MPYYRAVGEVPRKRHTQFRKPDGSLYAEELMGVEGFSSDSALLYHQHLPTAILDAVAVDERRLHHTADIARERAVFSASSASDFSECERIEPSATPAPVQMSAEASKKTRSSVSDRSRSRPRRNRRIAPSTGAYIGRAMRLF